MVLVYIQMSYYSCPFICFYLQNISLFLITDCVLIVSWEWLILDVIDACAPSCMLHVESHVSSYSAPHWTPTMHKLHLHFLSAVGFIVPNYSSLHPITEYVFTLIYCSLRALMGPCGTSLRIDPVAGHGAIMDLITEEGVYLSHILNFLFFLFLRHGWTRALVRWHCPHPKEYSWTTSWNTRSHWPCKVANSPW